MIPFERALVSSYRPSIVTLPLCLRVLANVPLCALLNSDYDLLIYRIDGPVIIFFTEHLDGHVVNGSVDSAELS